MNPSVTGLRRTSFGLVERLLDRVGGSHLIAVSPEEREHALELGIADRKVSMVVNGVDIDVSTAAEKRAAVRRELGLGDSHVCIGFVGRLTYQKAPEILIEAYKSLRAGNPDLRLVMLGDGEELGNCRALLGDELTKGTAHILAGRRGIDYMPAFDIFALPSRYEGMAYVHLEAATFGLPIVTSAVAGAGTVVSEGVNGFMARAGDVQDFTAALARGVEMVRQRGCAVTGVDVPSVAGMVDQVVSIYRQVRAR
jgi:glycosyltransferase involved in cell wall biosynthesis